MNYVGIIRKIISTKEYQEKTGIDLSHINTDSIKCVEIREELIKAPNRAEAFSKLINYIGPSKQPISLTVKLA